MKRFCVVTILFIIIVSAFVVPSFADRLYCPLPIVEGVTTSDQVTSANLIRSNGLLAYKNNRAPTYFGANDNYILIFILSDGYSYLVTDRRDFSFYYYYVQSDEQYFNQVYTGGSQFTLDENTGLFYRRIYRYLTDINPLIPTYSTLDNALSDSLLFFNNPPSQYNKNENVDEFIANTLISMGVKFNSYTSALPVAQSAWNYLIDENNWYIGSGDRNDKDIKWDIDTAVSYLNAQSNNYMDWYNGYKVSKDVTIALNKFIKDNYIASTLNNGTLAGENVYLNTQYMYASSGGSATGSSFGSSPSAFSFYPASTVTYFNGQYLHDNNEIDLDEFIYTPADVRKFISYPSSAGLIVPPEDSTGTGVITDGNGDTVYNIDLDFPSLDWLADAIQAVLDFLNRLITTIADFLTQILDAILSLFSDAFESLTTFGQGIIEWLYSVIESLGTLGSNYIPSDLWAIILPFIYLNVGIAILMFVLRSH